MKKVVILAIEWAWLFLQGESLNIQKEIELKFTLRAENSFKIKRKTKLPLGEFLKSIDKDRFVNEMYDIELACPQKAKSLLSYILADARILKEEFIYHQTFTSTSHEGISDLFSCAGKIHAQIGWIKIRSSPKGYLQLRQFQKGKKSIFEISFFLKDLQARLVYKSPNSRKHTVMRARILIRARKRITLSPIRIIHDRSCPERCKACANAIENAIKYLIKHQGEKGLWKGKIARHRKEDDLALVLTSLGGLALISSGSTHRKGPFRENLCRALDFVLENALRKKFLRDEKGAGEALMLMFLLEIYKIDPQERIKDRIAGLIEKLMRLRNRNSGAWGGYIDGNVVLTSAVVIALVAAKNEGFQLPKGVIKKATRYIEIHSNKDGGFGYGSKIFPKSTPTRTWTALSALLFAKPFSTKIKPAINHFRKNMDKAIEECYDPYFWFNLLFGSITAPCLEKEIHQRWERGVRRVLSGLQHKDGGWGNPFRTAIALIVLQEGGERLRIFKGGSR